MLNFCNHYFIYKLRRWTSPASYQFRIRDAANSYLYHLSLGGSYLIPSDNNTKRDMFSVSSHFLKSSQRHGHEVGERSERLAGWVGGRDFRKEMGLGWTLQRILGPQGSLDLGLIFV